MRFPTPDRLKFIHVAIFAIVVFVAQELEGTDFVFAALTAAYTLLWATAFNIAGGIRYPSGAFIFFNGFLNVIVGLTFKVFLLQPGERNLLAPDATMFCYCVGMVAMLAAAFLSRGLRPARGLLPGLDSVPAMKNAAIACLIVGAVISVVTTLGYYSTSTIWSALRQINKMPQMAIMLATTYEILHSKGKRSVNWIVLAGAAFTFSMGLISFGKEGMLLGFTAWFLAAFLQGYDFSRLQIAFCGGALFFFSYYLVPYSQYVRSFRAETFAANGELALQYLTNLNETRRLFEVAITDVDISNEPHLYDQREGFMDRVVVMAADDALISYTNNGHVFGLTPTIISYANIVPHFIWPNKPSGAIGNDYGHEIGILAEGDETTGIDFSPTADAYHQAKWLGLLMLLPADIFVYFILLDSVVGSIQWAPWSLVIILDVSKYASSGGLDSPVYSFSYGLFGILLMYWVVKRAAPFVLNVIHRRDIAAIVNAPPGGSPGAAFKGVAP